MASAPREGSQLPSLSRETSLALQFSLYTQRQSGCAMAFLRHIWHAAPPALRTWSGTSKTPEGVAYVPVAHLMPGSCLMMSITGTLNGLETSAQELRPDLSVVMETLTDGSFGSE